MPAETLKLFRVEYRHEGRVYATVAEAEDFFAAVKQFRRDNPHVELREFDEKANARPHAEARSADSVQADVGGHP